jgi:hypothetical protein
MSHNAGQTSHPNAWKPFLSYDEDRHTHLVRLPDQLTMWGARAFYPHPGVFYTPLIPPSPVPPLFKLYSTDTGLAAALSNSSSGSFVERQPFFQSLDLYPQVCHRDWSAILVHQTVSTGIF